MKFPNAYAGVKKLFTAEILSLIGVVALPDELLEAISGGWGDVVILPPEYGDYIAGMPLPR